MFLEDIITSEARVKILIELFSETNKHLYVRELTRRVGTEINAVRRELKRLTQAGLIKKEKRGNRLYYLIKKDYPFYYELVSMVAKEAGIGKAVLENQSRLGKIKLALLSAPFAEGRKSQQNELDLLLVGNINREVLEEIIKDIKSRTDKDVNYTILGDEEFEYLKNRRDVFLLSFLIAPNILLVGETDKYLTIS